MYDIKQPGWLNRDKPKVNVEPKILPRSRKWPLTVLAILLLAAVGLGIFVYLQDKQRMQSSSQQQPENTPQLIPAPEQPPGPDEQLQAVLSSWEESHPDREWSVVVQGLGDDERFAQLNPDKVYASASMYKLLLTYPFFQKWTLDEAEDLQVKVSGKSRNLLNCLNVMLRLSNNPCGDAIGRLIGWSSADKQLENIGLTNTKLNAAGGSRTSAGDTAKFLKDFHEDKLFNGRVKDYLLSTLREQTWRDGIPAGCFSCTVANKTGDLGNVRHDAAFIEHRDGVYALVIFTDGASFDLIAELTSEIHDVMTGNGQ